MSNPEQTLHRFRDVVVNNNSRMVLALSQALGKLSAEQQRAHFGGSYNTGFTYLYANDGVNAEVVMETVVSPQGDAITSLYQRHPIFASQGELMEARRTLIDAVAAKVGLSAAAVGVEDPGRGRTLDLAELSTGQLIDILAARMGASVVTTNSHGGDVDLVASEVKA